MQWDKVKNVLIGILLVVNLFLLGNLGFKIWQNYSRSAGLDADLRTLVSGYGSALSEDFRLHSFGYSFWGFSGIKQTRQVLCFV